MLTTHRALIAAAILAAGCSRASSTSTIAPVPSTASSSGPNIAISGPEKARRDSAQYPYTEADINFMQGMIHHHAQAIAMSKMAPSHGASAGVQTLAGRIINAQNDEIALMQNWLRDRNLPVPDATPGPMKMKMNGMEHEMLMPGMLSDAEMKQLDAARGRQFDELFLRYMIKHHQGAVSMVSELFGTYGAAQDLTTQKLAQDANIDQTTEIERMQRMLYAILSNPSP